MSLLANTPRTSREELESSALGASEHYFRGCIVMLTLELHKTPTQ